MAKGQTLSNLEAKKPKQDKLMTFVAAPPMENMISLGEHKKPRQ